MVGKATVRTIDRNPSGDVTALILQLSLARGLEAITATVRQGARALLGADGVTFVLRDGDYCAYVDEDAISPLWKGQRFPAERCISGWAMRHGQTVAIDDIYQDSRIPQDAYRLTFVKSLIMVPVRQEDPVAAIGAYWATRHRAGRAEIQLLQTIANAAAVALTNLALVEALEARAAEAERAREAAEAASRQKNRFLAACSHDLRQPFQAMRLFHSLLSERAAPADRLVVDKLGEAMTHGEELLGALLEVSTIESGLVVAAPSEIPLQEVFDRLATMFAAQAESKGLRLSIRPTPHRIVSDPLLLTRILGNLVGNALKYTASGGVVVAARRRGGRLSIEVVDTGGGIAPEHRDLVFEDFYQVGNAERDKRQGLGLGLGIVRRLAARLGHTVTLRSHPGRGSVFTVTPGGAGA